MEGRHARRPCHVPAARHLLLRHGHHATCDESRVVGRGRVACVPSAAPVVHGPRGARLHRQSWMLARCAAGVRRAEGCRVAPRRRCAHVAQPRERDAALSARRHMPHTAGHAVCAPMLARECHPVGRGAVHGLALACAVGWRARRRQANARSLGGPTHGCPRV